MAKPQSSEHDATTYPITRPTSSTWRTRDNWATVKDLDAVNCPGSSNHAVLVPNESRINHSPALRSDPDKYVALDCEMVGVGPRGTRSILARVSLVDYHGHLIYDSFVRPQEKVTDWRTDVTGITPAQMETAMEFEEVQTHVAQLIHRCVLVGHDLRHDLAALRLDHPKRNIRDTSVFKPFRAYGNGGKPSLKALAEAILGVEIQKGVHCSIDDARVTMSVFRRHEQAFEADHANRFRDGMTREAPRRRKQP
jgi:RNA exonuclease 4